MAIGLFERNDGYITNVSQLKGLWVGCKAGFKVIHWGTKALPGTVVIFLWHCF